MFQKCYLLLFLLVYSIKKANKKDKVENLLKKWTFYVLEVGFFFSGDVRVEEFELRGKDKMHGEKTITI